MPKRRGSGRRRLKGLFTAVAVVVLAGLMVLNTKFLSTDESVAVVGEKFSAEQYANENYESVIVPAVLEKAVPATDLLAEMQADIDKAGEAHGGRDGVQSAWSFPVSFSGVAGEVNTINGQLPVTIDGIPDSITVLVQTGPPVIGPALRNVTGQITFGMFTNQTEFQSVAVQLNAKVRENVLAGVDATTLKGKTIDVVGVFASDQWNTQWLVTPVKLETVG